MPAPCDIFSELYGNRTVNGTSVPSQMPYYQNYTVIFSKICGTPSFVSLYGHVTSTGDFGVGRGGKIGALPNLFFALTWLGACANTTPDPGDYQCEFEATWTGYLTNNSYSGPALMEYPAVYSVGEGSTATHAPSDLAAPILLLGVAAAGASVATLASLRVRKRRASESPAGSEPAVAVRTEQATDERESGHRE